MPLSYFASARTDLFQFLFCIRIPFVTFAWFVWFAIIQWTRPGGLLRKANLWCVLGIPGVWWIDIQVDGVRRGSLSQTPPGRLPSAGQVIASSYTSPLDVLYLAAIFDPIFTQSQAGSRLVRPVSIEAALASCFDVQPPPPFDEKRGCLPLADLIRQNKNRVIVVFPESTTSNGRGILKLSHSLLSATPQTRIFPVSLRYTPADVVTPIPGWLEAIRFIWRLNSQQTHCIRVRIGAPTSVASAPPSDTASSPAAAAKARNGRRTSGMDSNFFDTLDSTTKSSSQAGDQDEELSEQEQRVLDAVADALARLGRVKRVGLGVEEKERFVEAWSKGRKSR